MSENKMGTMPVGRLLLSMSLPMIVSMLVQALYNIVDSIFVAQLSEEALTAVSLAFPAQMLTISVCTGTGVGMNAFLSRSLGEKKFRIANMTAGNGLFLAGASYVVFVLIGVFLARPFFEYQTDIPAILEDGIVYLRICMIASFGIVFQVVFERLLQSTGRAALSMAVQLSGALINIVLDPILIFGLLGCPAMGVAGAATATVIGQICAGALAFYLNMKYNREITLSQKFLKPDMRIISRIYAVGIPSIIMASVGSVMIFGLNKILIQYSATATAVLGVYFKLQSFAFMPVFGLNNGMVPILSYNYGARNPQRMKSTINYGTVYAVGIMLAAFAIFQIFTPQLFGFFNASESMLAIGVPALRKISLSFLFAGFCVCTISVCQALGHGFMSLSVSFVRQIVVLLPSAYALSLFGGLHAIWWAFAIAEVVSVVQCFLFLRWIFDHDIKKLTAAV
ncbi:MATE family efflux transporter [Synergistaceae bacterium OttesenSCG-928-I11]|nr:MATE family efflux transporter [Synergistaceae bacterium OttesenSCG-928-I11]